MKQKNILLIIILFSISACGSSTRYKNFQEFKYENQTQLTYVGSSPQKWEKEVPPEYVTEIIYKSNGLPLKAWYAKPTLVNKNELIPAVVYVHGGFAFGSGDFFDALPFFENGFALLTPTVRGENGNPGNFELMFGEVDDVIAIVQWLGEQPGIDKNRIFVFGHSSGGGISALTALYDEPLINVTGSSGSLYTERVFYGWKNFSPFDYKNKTERTLRVLLGNTKYMKKSHIAYIGEQDSLAQNISRANNEILLTKAPLEIIMIQGDHYSSLEVAITNFIELIKEK